MTARPLALLALLALTGCPPPSLPSAPPPAPAAASPAALQSGTALVLVLDTSGSMDGSRLDTVKTVWRDTLSPKVNAYQNLTHQLDIGIVQCGNTADVIFDLSQNVPGVDSVIASLSSGGGTPLGHALANAYGLVMRSNRQDKHIFVLTDGAADSNSSPSQVLADMRARNDGVSVHLIGFQGDRGNYSDFDNFGAQVVMAEDAAVLNTTAEAIFADILKPEAE